MTLERHFISILGFTGGVAADGTDDAAVELEAVGGTTDGLKDMDGTLIQRFLRLQIW